jgi:hypothetical protein
LRRGSYRQLHVASEQFAFARELDGEAVIVMLNASEREMDLAVPAPRDGEGHDMLYGGTVRAAGGQLRAAVPAGWGRVLRAGQPAGPT